MKIVTAAQMKRIEDRAIQGFGIPSVLLMEHAALAVVDVILEHYPEADRIAILCGTGQNGGDGMAVARLLSSRGIAAELFLIGDRSRVKGDAALQLAICERIGISLHEVSSPDAVDEALARASQCDLVVDAIFGTGLSKPVSGVAEEVISGLAELRLPVVSVDVPSGLDASSHAAPATAVRSDLTVTFSHPKICHVFEPAASWCGEVVVASIGLPHAAVEAEGIVLSLTTPEEVAALCSERQQDSHKGSYGHVGIVAGSEGKSGAAILAARGALRAGAGLVTVLTDAATARIVDAVSVESMSEIFDLAGDLEVALRALSRFDAIVIGPGIEESDVAKDRVRELVRRLPKAVLIDASGLNAFAGRAGLINLRDDDGEPGSPPIRVITPHPGEAARLLGTTNEVIGEDRINAAIELARVTGAVTLLKGHQTLVADSAGPVTVNSTGNPGMATGGMGDVLSGMIGAFLARGWDPFEAARAAAYLHGVAGDLLAEAGDAGLVAMDLADAIPRALLRVREAAQ